MPVSTLAETNAAPVNTVTQSRDAVPAVNEEGFYLDLPAVDAGQLVGLIRTYRNSLTHREEAITRYLDENPMNVKDALITVIMPGGLIYAAIRKGNLEKMKVELATITEDMDELSYDLLAMQALAGELTVAQLAQ